MVFQNTDCLSMEVQSDFDYSFSKFISSAGTFKLI